MTGEKNEQPANLRERIFTPVFAMAMIPFLLVIVLALVFGDEFRKFTRLARMFLGTNFSWLYLIVVLLAVLVCVYVIFRPIGRIRLGDPDSKPDYSTFSWVSMLFAAGMGIGLVFYGAAEPLSHYAVQAPEAATFSQKALQDALKYSFFHYGISAWAVYALVALCLAYFQFRKKETTQISATLKPLFAQAMDGRWGQVIDSLTIFATVAGVSTSLGLGAAQINSGLNYLFGVPEGHGVQLTIIAVSTVLFLWSALSGIGKGIKFLSNATVIVAALLMVGAMVVGPQTKMVNAFTETLGDYLGDFLRLSLRTAATNPEEHDWVQKWTVMYWAWWIAWSPFVGVFIARVSKGRTIREFLIFVLLVPSFFSFLWLSVFGTLATSVVQPGNALVTLPIEHMLFGVFSAYPCGTLFSIVAILLVFIFFITSADSATVVLSMQSENGSLHPHRRVKFTWGLILSVVASVLLVNGGLNSLQNVLIITAFPFAIVILLMIVAVIKELAYEKKEMGLYIKAEQFPTPDAPYRSYERDTEQEDEDEFEDADR